MKHFPIKKQLLILFLTGFILFSYTNCGKNSQGSFAQKSNSSGTNNNTPDQNGNPLSGLTITNAPNILRENYQDYSVQGACFGTNNVSVAVGSVTTVSTPCQGGNWSASSIDTSQSITSNSSVTIVVNQGTSEIRTNVKRCISSGTGTQSNPKLICSYEELKGINENPEDHYAIDIDIDAGSSWSEGDSGCTPYDGTNLPTGNPCSGWTPLPLDGLVDGRGHTISNLYINGVSGATGLFSFVKGIIKNLHLKKVRIHSLIDDENSMATGGLVGQLLSIEGEVDHCSVRGKISSEAQVIGGLIGFSQGSVTNSYTHVEMEAHDVPLHSTNNVSRIRSVGGLVGRTDRKSFIMSSYTQGSISVILKKPHYNYHYDHQLGGLVGHGRGGKFYASYSKMKFLSGGSRTGGLIGVIERSDTVREGTTIDSKLHNSYFAGTIGSGLDPIEPIANSSGTSFIVETYQSVFWDSSLFETSSLSGPTGLTTTNMQVSCPSGSTSGICALGGGFQFSSGSYPKIKKCTKCVFPTDSENPTFSNTLIDGQGS